jgi:hypothetical protein
VANLDVLEVWLRNAPRATLAKADEWLNAIELVGPDIIPHAKRMKRGREEYAAIFSDVDLVISYLVVESQCTVGIINVTSVAEYEGRG